MQSCSFSFRSGKWSGNSGPPPCNWRASRPHWFRPGRHSTAARRNADEVNELYRQGLATALELADATQQLFEAEVAEVTARYRMAQAYLAVREARGISPAGE